MMYCNKCGAEMPDDSRFCPSCGAGVGGPSPVRAQVVYTLKNEAVAIILSVLITGLGHIYIGKTGRGIKLLVLNILLNILTFGMMIINPILALVGILAVVVWIYAIVDSYGLVKEYNEFLKVNGQPPW